MTRMKTVLAVATLGIAAASCQDSGTKLGNDTSTDTPVDATVPACSLLDDWDLAVTQTSSGVGTLSADVTLLSSGVVTSCAGPPCLVVTETPPGSATISGLVQESPTAASFSYTNDSIAAGGTAQVLLRWRVMCTEGGVDQEQLVTDSPWICADSSRQLSIGPDPCP